MTTPCLLCGGCDLRDLPDATALVRAPAGHRVARCLGCGLEALHPPFTPAEKAAIYGPEYFDAYEAVAGIAGGDAGLALHLAERLARVEARLGKGRLLDVGCGRGFLLAHAESLGWEADGIEASPAALEAGRRVARGRLFHGPVEEAPFEPGRYRFIHINHVLEHLDDPVSVLRRVAEWLAPGGLVAVEVPNEFHTLFYWLGRIFLPRAARVNPLPTAHEFFFTPVTLRRAAEKAGLRVESIATLRRAFGLQNRLAPLRWIKRVVYLAEKPLGMAGMIEMWASVPK